MYVKGKRDFLIAIRNTRESNVQTLSMFKLSFPSPTRLTLVIDVVTQVQNRPDDASIAFYVEEPSSLANKLLKEAASRGVLEQTLTNPRYDKPLVVSAELIRTVCRWNMIGSIQASLLGQFSQYTRALAVNEAANVPGVSAKIASSWLTVMMEGIEIKSKGTKRRVPFLLRPKAQTSTSGGAPSQVFSLLSSQPSTVTVNDYEFFSAFIDQVSEEVQAFLDSFASSKLEDFTAAEISIILRLSQMIGILALRSLPCWTKTHIYTVGILIGLGFHYETRLTLQLPTSVTTAIINADDKKSEDIYTLLVNSVPFYLYGLLMTTAG